MKNKQFNSTTIESLLKFEAKEITKKELFKELDKVSKEKKKKCIKKDGSFDYLKISEMYHNGEW